MLVNSQPLTLAPYLPAIMDNSDGKREYVDHWKRVGPLLEQFRHEELRAMTDEGTARAFQSLSSLVDDLPERAVRPTSGFVEQQRLFLRSRKA